MDNEEIVRRIQANKDLSERNMARIEKLEKGQEEFRDLVKAVNGMVVEQKNIRNDLTEMKSDVKQIKEKPAKKWDSAVDKVLTLIIGAVVLYMLAQIGL
jgi:allophanate hydrolase subunit 1